MSARQVICGRFGFSVFPFTHSSLSHVKSKLFLILFGIHPSPLLPHPLWYLRSGHFPESRTFSFGTWEVPERLAMFPVQLLFGRNLNCFHSLAFKSPYIHTYIHTFEIRTFSFGFWDLLPYPLWHLRSGHLPEIRGLFPEIRPVPSPGQCACPLLPHPLWYLRSGHFPEIRTFSFGTWECFLTNIVWVKFELFSFIGRRCLLFRGITTWFQI